MKKDTTNTEKKTLKLDFNFYLDFYLDLPTRHIKPLRIHFEISECRVEFLFRGLFAMPYNCNNLDIRWMFWD